jgi:hypothetical protein
MKNIRPFRVIVIVFTLLFFGGVISAQQVAGNTEAAILSFQVDGIVGAAEIDASKHAVQFQIELRDLSQLAPIVTVSDGAKITNQPALQDGSAVTYMVTGEGGKIGLSVRFSGEAKEAGSYQTGAGVIEVSIVEMTGAGPPSSGYDPCMSADCSDSFDVVILKFPFEVGADMVGMFTGTMSRWEQGKSSDGAGKTALVSAFFKVSRLAELEG